MLKVQNKKIVNQLTWKSLKANKSRNFIAICAIALTCLLFTSLLTMGIGTVKAFQDATLRQAGGDGHVVLKYINNEIYNKVKNHSLIKEISYNQILADAVDNKELIKKKNRILLYG